MCRFFFFNSFSARVFSSITHQNVMSSKISRRQVFCTAALQRESCRILVDPEINQDWDVRDNENEEKNERAGETVRV